MPGINPQVSPSISETTSNQAFTFDKESGIWTEVASMILARNVIRLGANV